MTLLADAGTRLGLAVPRAYFSVFATSRAAKTLSRPRPVRHRGYELELWVASVERAAEGVVAITLIAPGRTQLPAWTPGAHLDVVLPSGRQRQYSLCGDPTDRHSYRIAVRLMESGGGGSRAMHALAPGDRVTVRGPRNAFHLVPEPAYLFVAAGIGITPILPMAREAHRQGARWRLAYLGRTIESMPFLDELAGYGERVEVRTDVDHGQPDLRALLAQAEPGAAVYFCGPPALAEDAKTILGQLNPTARFHSERFTAPPVRGGEAFTIRLSRSGAEVEVGPDESALTALRRVSPATAYSCQQGFCGTCKMRVLDGEVDHRDNLLLEDERPDSMLVCVSRARGTLVLDL